MKEKPKVFVSRKIPDAGLELLKDQVDLDIWEDQLPPSQNILAEKLRNADGAITLLSDTINSETLKDATNLKVIANYAVGFNNIDLSAAKNKNIKIGNTPDVLTDATADIAISLLLTVARLFRPAIENVLEGNWKTWEPMGFLGQKIHGKTLGIIGMGRIGENVALKLQSGWNMKVLYYSHSPKKFNSNLKAEFTDFKNLISRSDFISIHCSLNEKTKELIGENEFNSMKKNCIVINTARGEIVDSMALFKALRDNKIFGAGLDVTDPEPLQADHPLLKCQNLICLPHIGSATEEARNEMSIMAAKNIIAGLNDLPLPFEV